MTRIFISHSHVDKAIAFKLFDFLICVFPELKDEDILCTSDSNSGLLLINGSGTISDQLKRQLQEAEALFALITTDSLQSLWVLVEISSFWNTDKPFVLILESGLTPSELPEPFNGCMSIQIEDEHAFDQINFVTNELGKKLNMRKSVNRLTRDRLLKEFLTRFRDIPPITSEKGIDYTKLRDFLAAGNWQEADKETAKVMLEVFGKQTYQDFREEDLDPYFKYPHTFPDKDFSTINKLWLHYSHGKFGFSVQKRIHNSIGGTPTYNPEVWAKFGNCVGWRRQGEWRLQNSEHNSDHIFNLKEAPPAHLPAQIHSEIAQKSFWYGKLFSLMNNCL